MDLLEVFDEVTVKSGLEQAFAGVDVAKVVASKSRKEVIIKCESAHLLDHRDIKMMEAELDSAYFSRTGNRCKIEINYNMQQSFDLSGVWKVYKKSLLEEIKEISHIYASFLDGADIDIVDREDGNSVMEIVTEDSELSVKVGTEVRKELSMIFSERFGIEPDIMLVQGKKFTPKSLEQETIVEERAVKPSANHSETRRKPILQTGSFEKEQQKALEKEPEAAVTNVADKKQAEQKPADKKQTETKVPEDKGNAFKKNDFKGGFSKSKFLRKKIEDDPDLFYGAPFDAEDVKVSAICEVDEYSGTVVLKGKIIKLEDPIKMRNRDSYIFAFAFTDFTDTIVGKLFIDEEDKEDMLKLLKPGTFIKIKGSVAYDDYSKEVGMTRISGIKTIPNFTKKRVDDAEVKRVELHAHTMMSDMDAVIDPGVLVKTAFSWGHRAVAITDHGVVQGFTDAFHTLRDLQDSKNPDEAARAKEFKILYGCEIYLVDDIIKCVKNSKNQDLNVPTVVYDLETTGLNKLNDKIIEIGAVKLINNEIVDRYSVFVNPQEPLSAETTKLTSITDSDVAGAKTIEEVLPEFIKFCEGCVTVGHNVWFDDGFISINAERLGIPYEPTVVDTVGISQALLTGIKNYKLDTVAAELDCHLEFHHRAVHDAECTALIYQKLCKILNDKGITTLDHVRDDLKPSVEAIRKKHPFHCIVLCKNETGRINLYKMISQAHLTYFQRQPKIPKSMLVEHREGLIIGSACEAGELYRCLVEGGTTSELAALCEFYDYYEIQPLGNNQFMIESDKYPDINTPEDLEKINERIVELGEQYGKLVVATCDTHFLNPEDEVYRRFIMYSKGFDDADKQAPLFFRTTNEMLSEFAYLGTKKCNEVVIENPNKICDMIEKIEPVRPDKCPPVIEDSDNILRKICNDTAHEMYGEVLPEPVESRLTRELESIIKNGYAVMYIIAQKLVWKSNEDGYLVGSRGSVGSSFVATMAGITEVNPLPAHYYCKKCKYSDFESETVKQYQHESICGYDLPDKVCPVCGEPLVKDGSDIPFETFLGFDCDKEPDIDLNFSGEYQAKAHDYTEVIFGKGQTFKAGTVGTVAEKTAYGYGLKYDEEHGLHHRRAELERLTSGCVGVRRSTGQHPGGIIVLPVGEDIDTFTPVQHPANDMTSNIVTTHFDYHSIDHNLLKLDILGHDDPTMIKRLEELTGVDAKKIPMDDPDVISLFHGTESLGIKPEDIMGIDMGSLGLPELGTDNAMKMLRETKPQSFTDMVRISGLSHGTDVYANNAQELILNGTCTLQEAICTRDDIMLYLINKGLKPGTAFKIMENVRKGKVAKKKCPQWDDWKKDMLEHGVPEWYIWSCERIQYMFPKAHAAAYIMMAFRVAWFKVHMPQAYYAAYFGIRATAFDYELMCLGKEKLVKNMNEVKARIANHTASAKDEDTYMNMKSVLEMYARGLEFEPIDIFTAKPHAFQIVGDKVMPSLDKISGLGEKAADLMYEACKGGKFTSKQNFKDRTHCSQAVVDTMSRLNLLGDLPETDQLSIFDFMQM